MYTVVFAVELYELRFEVEADSCKDAPHGIQSSSTSPVRRYSVTKSH
jgi:hypothetical protein